MARETQSGAVRMNQKFNEAQFEQLPLVGILRFFPRDQVERMVPAALAGGLVNFEVTMNSAGAEELIRVVRELVGDRGNVGAGTVAWSRSSARWRKIRSAISRTISASSSHRCEPSR